MRDNVLWHPFIFGGILFPLAVLSTVHLAPDGASAVACIVVAGALTVVMASSPDIVRSLRWISRRLATKRASGD